MGVKIHSIKITPDHFEEVITGNKKAELRKYDRNYRLRDLLLLQEWSHGKYTGRECAAVVTHMLPVNALVPAAVGWVILSIKPLNPFDAVAYMVIGGDV
jgi:hypothetical protein